MSRFILGWSAIAVLIVTAAAAQAPPNLTGKWTLVPETDVRPGPQGLAPATAGSGWGSQIMITQEAGRLVIERSAQFSSYDVQPPMQFTYLLDGSESRNVINMGRGPQAQISRAGWKGNTLVISTRHAATSQANAPAPEVTHVFSLDGTDTLILEMTRQAGEAPATKARYRRN